MSEGDEGKGKGKGDTALIAEAIDRMVNGENAGKIIDEIVLPLLGPPAKEGGQLIAGVLRAVRGLPAFLAGTAGRMTRLLVEAVRRVPSDRRLAQPSEQAIVLLLEASRNEPEDTPLWEMFAELLAKTLDRDQVALVHPAFTSLLSQMTPDEARIVAWLAVRWSTEPIDYHTLRQRKETGAISVSARYEVPAALKASLTAYDKFEIQLRNLERLGILEPWGYTSRTRGRYAGILDAPDDPEMERLHLTPFGRLFADAVSSSNQPTDPLGS